MGFAFSRALTFSLPDRIKVGHQDRVLSLPNDIGVRFALIEILLDDCYGLLNSPLATSVLDIGGNVGLFAVAARLRFPTATIHSYEANPALEPYLAVQADAFDFEYFLQAVGLQGGRARLEFGGDLVVTRARSDPSGQVPMVAFREAVVSIGGCVDLLKLDCEGAEWSILLDRESLDRVTRLALDYHLESGHSHEDALKIVRDLGFKVLRHEPTPTNGLLLASR